MRDEERLVWLQLSSPSEVGAYLGERARAARHASGLTQTEFARDAGVALRTYKRFEAAGAANLETFIKVLQLMGQGKHLATLFPVAPGNAIPMTRSRALGLEPER